jgi:hypothetical protein
VVCEKQVYQGHFIDLWSLAEYQTPHNHSGLYLAGEMDTEGVTLCNLHFGSIFYTIV